MLNPTHGVFDWQAVLPVLASVGLTQVCCKLAIVAHVAPKAMHQHNRRPIAYFCIINPPALPMPCFVGIWHCSVPSALQDRERLCLGMGIRSHAPQLLPEQTPAFASAPSSSLWGTANNRRAVTLFLVTRSSHMFLVTTTSHTVTCLAIL